MRINYSGDKAEIYNGYMLSDDDYNSHATWTVGLNRQEHSVEGKELTLVIYKLDKDEKKRIGEYCSNIISETIHKNQALV